VRLVSPAEPHPARNPRVPPAQGSDAAGTHAERLEIATPPSLEPLREPRLDPGLTARGESG
jgi:hypothetical protein